MSGHSKWATIKRKKAAIDAKRGKIFTKLIKEITVAVRQGGPVPENNPRLRLVIDNAKSVNMPADNIERAIKKASGEMEGVIYSEITYEGYAPAGVALMVEVVTDNKNRAAAEVRHIFSKYGGNMGAEGSVAWMFERRGVITGPVNGKTEDEIMDVAIEAGADDCEVDEGYFEMFTTIENFEDVRKAIMDKGISVENASLQWVPKNRVAVSGEDVEKVMKIIEMFEDNDDVQNVYHNADFQ
jgi:YebC/PmpR family DNA-binding regulatory protein